MRIVWTLLKVIIGLAIAIPVGILGVVLAAGLVGTFVGVAILAIKLACLGLVGYGLYRLASLMFAPAPKSPPVPRHDLPAPDPYYEAAMRELDAEFRGPTRP